VLARHAAVDGWPGAPQVQRRLWTLAEALLPHARLADYTQALMDLGATVCTARRPGCMQCPVAGDCAARAQDAVARYPQPKPRKARPRRQARLLLAYDGNGALLLERRPPLGIWGGLWCPPLLDDERLASAGAAALLDGARDIEPLPPIAHGFTHFDLELQPLRLRVEPPPALGEPESRRWVAAAEALSLGLPAPIRKLLASFSKVPPR
jgi:A/G-specific adenine glycosylase